MHRSTIDDLKLWYVVVGAQSVHLGILALVGTVPRPSLTGGMQIYFAPDYGCRFFGLVSLVAFVCSVFEKKHSQGSYRSSHSNSTRLSSLWMLSLVDNFLTRMASRFS